MESENVDTTDFEEEADRLRQDGASVIFAAVDRTLAGCLAIADPIKETTAAAVSALQRVDTMTFARPRGQSNC